jgi:hypothetical protein
VGKCELGASGSGQGPMAGCCEHGNEPSGSIKGKELLDLMRNYQLIKKDSVESITVNY